MNAFAEAGGSLKRIELIKLVRPVFSNAEGAQIYNHIVKTTLSRLRALLQKELNLGKKADPVPWGGALKCHRMLITVGYSEEDDQHRPQFRTREQLAN